MKSAEQSPQPMTQQVYLHYFNANAEERLPHALEFGPVQGRLVTDENIQGQVVTVVGIGLPRRYYIWSTFFAEEQGKNYNGKSMVSGKGWHLCPPREIPDENIRLLTDDKLSEHLFIPVNDPRIAAWLVRKAHKYQPPGEPQKLVEFLEQLLETVFDERLEIKIRAAMRAARTARPPDRRWGKQE